MNAATAAALSDSESLLTPEQVATLMRCSSYTLARWRREGRGPKFRRIGPSKVYYALADVRAFMDCA